MVKYLFIAAMLFSVTAKGQTPIVANQDSVVIPVNLNTVISATPRYIRSGTATLTGKTMSGANNTFTAIPNSALTNSTISGVALGSNLPAHTAGNGLSGTNYNGTTARTWTADTSILRTVLNSWSKAQADARFLKLSGGTLTGDLTIGGLVSGNANTGVSTLPSSFYNTSSSKWLIVNNRSNGAGETDYLSAPGNGGVAFGGHRWYNVNSSGVETVQMDLNGTTSALTVTGPVVATHNAATGTDDVLVLSGSPANEIKKRSLANFKSDLGMPISGSYSYSVTAETTFTVTIGTTMDNNTYKVNVTPTSALGRQPLSVENKTTTTFDVVFTGLPLSPGTLTFDWVVYP